MMGTSSSGNPPKMRKKRLELGSQAFCALPWGGGKGNNSCLKRAQVAAGTWSYAYRV